ncbi:MAG: ABC transporter permease [Tepidamorphaceae bacterium]|nr:ABC transporter permease [Rhodobiaceae bacterium]MCC0049731.1 ABC transporter permease [Rhodobiaceae bacterium]
MAEASRSNAPWLLSGPGLVLFAALLGTPLILTVILSFYQFDYSIGGIKPAFSFENYRDVLTDPYFHKIFGRTFGVSLIVTVFCVLIGAPEAYILNRMRNPWKSLFLLVVIGPLLISVIVRTLGWALLFGGQGGISTVLQWLGIVDEPVSLMFTMTGMTIALVHVLVPFMVLAVWASLQRLDPQVEDAALSLGASQATVLRRIVLPQIMPGILSGSLIVFSLTASAFATPSIIGGRRMKVVSTTAYDEYLSTLNWPLGAAIAIVLLIATAIIIMSYNRLIERRYARVFE